MEYPNKLYQLRTSIRKSQSDLAKILKISQSEYSRLEKGKRRLGVHHKPLSEYFVANGAMSADETLTDLSQAVNLSEPVFYAPNAQTDLPVFGKPLMDGGLAWTERPIDMIQRPNTLTNNVDAYSCNVAGDDMKPRLMRGNKILVDPTTPPVSESIVVVEYKKQKNVRYIRELKEFKKQTVILKSYNPEKTYDVKSEDILHIHKVCSIRV